MLLRNTNYLEKSSIKNLVKFISIQSTNKSQFLYFNNFKMLNNVYLHNQKRNYDAKVMEHFEKPKNTGSFDKNDPTVGTGLVGAAACGDLMKLQIKVDPQSNEIVDACFKTYGCTSAIASSSYGTEYIKNKSLDDAIKLTNKDIATELNLPPVKLHCSVLGEEAIKEAIKDYKSKQLIQ